MITACKRNLGQSNVFTHVCHSVHRGKVSASGGRDLHPGGVCLQGGSASRGSDSRGSASRGSASGGRLHLGRVCIQGVCLGEVYIQWGRLELGQTPSKIHGIGYYGIRLYLYLLRSTSGWYASYCNAFLLLFFS